MKLKKLFVGLVFLTIPLFVLQTNVYAGVTGKIAGTITDAQTNDPLPGANVVLENTTMGAATNLDGKYTILNVPPGAYTLRVSMIGYSETRIENIRVSIDLTTTRDVQLSETVLESGETVTIVAEQPLVQKDMTSSLARVSSDEIKSLPVANVSDVIQLQAGVIREGNDFHIRGGRANEVAFRIDGVDVTDVYSGESMGAVVENAAIQELQVVSGTFNAEYGQAMSGIINIITKEGGQEYSGRINSYAGDYYSTNDVYEVFESVEPATNPETGALITNPETGRVEEIETTEDPLDELNLTLNTEASLSGPLFSDKLTFFANGRYVEREGYIYGRELFTPLGTPGDSSLVPMHERYDWSGFGKLTYRLHPNLKLSYQFLTSKGHNDRNYGNNNSSRQRRFVPGSFRQGNSESRTHIVSWTHTLSANTFYEARFSALSRSNNSYLYDDPLAMPNYLVSVAEDTALGIAADTLNPSIAEDMAAFEALMAQDATYEWFPDPNGPLGHVDPDLYRVPISFSGAPGGTDNFRTFRDYNFWNAKLDFTSQVNPTHQLKAGIEFKIHELARDEYTLQPDKTETGEEIIPWTPVIPEVSSLQRDKYSYKPYELSTYFQDKIEIKDIILNLGVRLDYFAPEATIPSDERDPDIYNPFRDENIYRDWIDPPAGLSPPELEAYRAQFEEYTPEERAAFMHKDVSAKVNVSPRVGIAFPITDRGIIHFSYGHFISMPGLQYLYNNADYKLQSGGGNRLLGNPDLAPEKTVHYELGLQQQLGEDVGLDVTLFYKDTRGWVGATPLIETVRPSVAYSRYRNEDYSNVYGMTFEIQKRFDRYFSARLHYTYQLAEGTYSNPNDAFNDVFNSSDPQEPRIALIPMGWDQRHTVNAFLTWRRGGWFVGLTGKFNTGQPYTPAISKGEIVGASTYVGWTSNSATKPSLNSIDLRFMRNVRFAGLDLQLYTLIYNLLDQAGQQDVYGETGDAEFSPNLITDYGGYSADRIGSFNESLRKPQWFQAPREIQLGLAIEF